VFQELYSILEKNPRHERCAKRTAAEMEKMKTKFEKSNREKRK